MLRWGVSQFDVNVRSPVVIGNTVVSSVNRGPADLSFGGRPVVLTAGYPALSPMMGLTHGVHGIGETIAISVHAAASALADIDIGDQTYESLARKGETMTTAAMATYAYDQIDQARTELERPRFK